ncbi:MAG: YwmB family TATA-box binding protein [Peptococcaceae bacterium]
MKSYSSLLAFLGILALLVMPVCQINYARQDYLDIVTKSFKTTKANFYELKIEGWEQIYKKGLSQEELQAYFSQIAKRLNLDEFPQFNDIYEDFTSIYHTEELEENVDIEISLQSFFSPGMESGTFLGIQLTSQDLTAGSKYYKIISELFSGTDKIGVTIVGNYPGQVAQGDLYAIIAGVFSEIKARIVEGIHTPDLLSFSAFTPKCPGYIEVAEKKININIAARYHSLDDKTYIHVGAPLIFQEY